MQHWFGLSGPAWKTPFTRSSRCAGLPALELVDDALPDETTILNFRRLLERHPLSARLTNVINDVLTENGLLLKGGTMVDAALIQLRPPPGLRPNSVTPRCVRPTRATSGTSA